MLTTDQITFRHLQSFAPGTVQVFLSVDGTLADGSPVNGPLRQIDVTLTDDEAAVALAVVNRAKQALADQANGSA